MGPIDYLVIELAPGTEELPTRIGETLARMIASGMVRILDLLLVHHDRDTGLSVREYEDVGATLPAELGGSLAEILALEDLDNLAPAIEPGRSAAILVWEYVCARQLIDAAAASDAQLVAQGRIPLRAIVSSLSWDE
jgi:hypothetical protein